MKQHLLSLIDLGCKQYFEVSFLNNVKDVYKFQGTAFFENTRVAETEFTLSLASKYELIFL